MQHHKHHKHHKPHGHGTNQPVDWGEPAGFTTNPITSNRITLDMGMSEYYKIGTTSCSDQHCCYCGAQTSAAWYIGMDVFCEHCFQVIRDMREQRRPDPMRPIYPQERFSVYPYWGQGRTPCDYCTNNPKYNPNASGICHCIMSDPTRDSFWRW